MVKWIIRNGSIIEPGAYAEFVKVLYRYDRRKGKQTKEKGCPLCKGRLHDAHYQRKPRGIVGHLDEKFKRCFCYCCAKCRHRVWPPSLRFLGAKVYFGFVVLLRAADQLQLKAPLRKAIAPLAVCHQTAARWRTWWQEQVPKTSFWCDKVAVLMPPIEPTEMPDPLVSRFDVRVGKMLHFIAPLVDSLRSAKLVARGVAIQEQAPG